MKAKIGQKVYDTSKAIEVGSSAEGYFGDPKGFEEKLYLKDSKEFFLHAIGGSESQYAKEQIIPLNIEDSASWLDRVAGSDYTASVLAALEEKPAVEKAATPAVKKPAAEKAAKPAVKKPAAEKAAKPAVKKPAVEKTAKPAAEKSVSEKSATPAAKKPAAKKKA